MPSVSLHTSTVPTRPISRRRPCPRLASIRSRTVQAMSIPEARAVNFRNQQGQKLAGILTTARQPIADPSTNAKPKCVILCHGYTDHKNGFHLPALAAALADVDFNSLRFDFNGNGDSEGTFRLAGYLAEVADIAAAKEYLEQEEGQQVVGLLGHSKGGGDVIIYAGIHDNIPLVINIAGRFWMKEGLTQRFGADISERVEQGPVNQKSTTERGKTIEWQLTQEDLQERVTLDMAPYCAAIKNSKVLTIHGTADSTIPVQDGQQIADRIAGSEIVVVQDADHNFRTGSTAQTMIDAVVRFIKDSS